MKIVARIVNFRLSMKGPNWKVFRWRRDSLELVLRGNNYLCGIDLAGLDLRIYISLGGKQKLLIGGD